MIKFKKPSLMSFEPALYNGNTATKKPISNGERAGNKAVGIVDKLTKLPGNISKFGDNLNDKFISIAKEAEKATETFSNKAPGKVKGNLTENKLGSLGRQAGEWIKGNPLVAGAVGLALVFFVFRGAFK